VRASIPDVLRLTLLALLAALLAAAGGAVATPAPVRLAEAPGVVGAIGKTIGPALRFGVDPSDVPTVVLDGRRFADLYRRISGRAATRVTGFEYRGVIHVRDHVLAVNKTIVAHEILHALSQRFSREARARGYGNLIEGVTDYFTHKVIPARRLGEAGFPRSAYGRFEATAAELAALVGDDVLADCYFRRGFDALERAVDAKGGAGRMAAAARPLQLRPASVLARPR
jgi:hypothetical protein